MDNDTLSKVLKRIKEEYPGYRTPVVTELVKEKKDPYKVLISCLLSLRTKDEVTAKAQERLFKEADTPRQMLGLDTGMLEKLIYPVGFYKRKAMVLHDVSRTLIDQHGGRVPDDLDELLLMKGVGRKTANLVMTMGFDKPGICVDTHVHRISNRFGYVSTKTPYETEMALREKLPEKHWIEINELLVTWGQNVCKPISPFCSKCVANELCERIGVERSR
ncbi:MAG: endonuclease III [Candidatus Thermoplasmatota archaeon]|nr:endonuclease III [Candidatus Thermoplasmatota archaeon]